MTDEPTAPRSPRLPVQGRSRHSMRRVLDAAEELLEERAFDQISITEIARRAKVTIGSLYLRFPSKQVLIDAVHARYSDECELSIREAAEPERWTGRSLEQRVVGLVAFVVELYRTRRGVIRSLSVHYRIHPETATAELVERNDRMFHDLESILLGARREIEHPDPELAVHFAVQMISAMCREKILFPDYPIARRAPWTSESLSDELRGAALGYLRQR